MSRTIEDDVREIKSVIIEVRNELSSGRRDIDRLQDLLLGDPEVPQFPGLVERFVQFESDLKLYITSHDGMIAREQANRNLAHRIMELEKEAETRKWVGNLGWKFVNFLGLGGVAVLLKVLWDLVNEYIQ